MREYISTYFLHLYGVSVSDYLFILLKTWTTDELHVCCMYSQIGLIVSKLKKQTTPNCWTMRLLVCNLHFLLFFLFFLSFLPFNIAVNAIHLRSVVK